MGRVVIVGCGVVGAAIAYELSTVEGLEITVLDRQPPAQGATGAALGILMGAISHKIKGRGWRLRELSLRQYAAWLPELETLTGQAVPCNRAGIVRLTFDDDDMDQWQTLQSVRQKQGWPLEIWDLKTLVEKCPLVGHNLPTAAGPYTITGAIYSPQDRQIDPAALTHALVVASQKRGVQFHFDAGVEEFAASPSSGTLAQPPYPVHTTGQSFEADWVILSAGVGTPPLTQTSPTPLDIRPVLGQALRIRLPKAITPPFQPVITGHDIHVVPLGAKDYWVGATVEFPDEAGMVKADAELLNVVWQGAIALYPRLAQGTVVEQWSGERPRPFGRPAPIVERLDGYEQVILATGHYRNGVLLAPATAHWVRELMGFP
ncbi:MAG: FAD-dependent oxidoreductase [Leptolyngbyaceae bacterium]|nr:FAD-dependent oxidoreductase [Leptolyngbyaceae bacterium]